ncbi:MAG: DUF5989 family protein [Pirellulaceae bacterium]|nr:DUF5989 family protein [Pirellulaceae bacterium]
MDDSKANSQETSKEDFDQLAGSVDPGFFEELWDFMRYNKKWWLTPIVLSLLLMGALILLSGSTVAPFIYSLW